LHRLKRAEEKSTAMPPSYQYRERDYEFANTFVTLRTTIGLTQQGLATLLGVSSRAVENWEQGLTNPKAEYLKAFLALCVRASAFAAGREEEQIRAFWRTAHQKVLLDEYWLSELLARPSPSPAKLADEQSPGAGQGRAAASEAIALWTVPYARNPHFTGRDELLDQLTTQLSPQEAGQPMALRRAALTQAQVIKGLGASARRRPRSNMPTALANWGAIPIPSGSEPPRKKPS
jgi:transcriptional regulator with XRE-family HTH domain